MLSLLNHSKGSLALTAVSVLHYATIPQESGIFLMQTTSQDFHPALPGECPDNVLLSTWLLLHSLSCWNHFHMNDHYSLPISLVKCSWILETCGLPRWLRWWGICLQCRRPGLGRSPGDGNGNPFQCSWLENPLDRGAWQATVRGLQRVGRNRVTNTHIDIYVTKCFCSSIQTSKTST